MGGGMRVRTKIGNLLVLRDVPKVSQQTAKAAVNLPSDVGSIIG